MPSSVLRPLTSTVAGGPQRRDDVARDRQCVALVLCQVVGDTWGAFTGVRNTQCVALILCRVAGNTTRPLPARAKQHSHKHAPEVEQCTSAPPRSSAVTSSPVAAFTSGGPPRKLGERKGVVTVGKEMHTVAACKLGGPKRGCICKHARLHWQAHASGACRCTELVPLTWCRCRAQSRPRQT